MKGQPLLSIVIPCLNERDTIKRCVLEAEKYAKKLFSRRFEIIVADNGSTDGTLKILKKIPGVNVLHVPLRGYGAALHWGILKSHSDYVLFADADLSYPFSNIKNFSKLLELKPDLALGTRLKGRIENNSMPILHRYIGTPFLTFLIKNIYKIQTTDCNSGMRMVKKSFYKSLNMRNSGMEWASELLIRTALRKGVYAETPITFRKDQRSRRPHLDTWADGWRHLKSILLLKPSSLYLPLLLLVIASIVLIYYSIQPWGVFISSVTVMLLFSILAAHFIDDHLNEKETNLYNFLREFTLIPTVGGISIIFILVVLILPSDFLTLKILILNSLAILYIWVFLIETIKTHLVKRLPDSNDL